jgi:hypothetical protein
MMQVVLNGVANIRLWSCKWNAQGIQTFMCGWRWVICQRYVDVVNTLVMYV